MSAAAAAPPTSRHLSPRERLELLCDPATFMALRTGIRSDTSVADGDGVVAGAGTVAGRPIYCYAQDPGHMGGSLGHSHADSIVRAMRLAGESGAPVVGLVESGGARLQDGHEALAGYGRIFRASVELSRRVPQISVVSGVSAGGGAYSPALTDFVVMTEDARMFLTGPKIVRDVISTVVDGGRMMELDARWARNMVTGLARIDGRPVGVVANQPRWLGGVIDSDAAEKGALFVDRCSRFGLPLVVLVDTPGFMPGTRQEGAGVIRYGAQLLRSFAAAAVPKLTVIMRKAYGGAVITMNSRDLGADMVFAWPDAEIGIMAARQAVGITERRTIEAAPDPSEAHDELADEYAGEHLTASAAAVSGFVDEVIEPGETRARLSWALALLGGPR
jgi:acetyl-CoA carboxylase carboxyltransferase component